MYTFEHDTPSHTLPASIDTSTYTKRCFLALCTEQLLHYRPHLLSPAIRSSIFEA